ncbi:TrbC family F-type conjugative pilus assembly protein [Neisseria sp. P0020.S005]|uniref:TrbC family F-type conjugative pilus assembly protein n=1 Tax=Neisseria sp. P0020.S005 TaxID=3436810 RepID=UPI003F8024B9
MTPATGGRILSALWLAACAFCFEAKADDAAFLSDLIRQQKARSVQFTKEAEQLTAGSRRLPAGQNPTMEELQHTRTVVFLSRSMPEQIVLGLLEQGAGRKDVVFAYRGWGNGSVEEMFDYTDTLYKKLSQRAKKNPPNIIVQPAAFAEYQITYVPALLHQDSNNKWYLVQGVQNINASVNAVKERRFNQRLSQQWRVSEPDQADVMRRQAQKRDWNKEAAQARQDAQAALAGRLNLPAAAERKITHVIPYQMAAFDITDPKTGKVLYPRGTRFNVLALDPAGVRGLVVIDGRNAWQVRFAQAMKKYHPDLVVLYTRLGRLDDAGLNAAPLDDRTRKLLQVKAVPTYYRQNGKHFDVVEVKNP